MKSIIFTTLFSILFSIVVFSQSNIRTDSIEDGWKGIIPLVTTREEVEKQSTLLATATINARRGEFEQSRQQTCILK